MIFKRQWGCVSEVDSSSDILGLTFTKLLSLFVVRFSSNPTKGTLEVRAIIFNQVRHRAYFDVS